MKKMLCMIMVIAILLAAVHVEISAAGNNVESMYEEGMEYFEKDDYDHAFSYFQISGEVKSYAPAQNMLGVCYRDGLGIETDVAEAEKYFKLSADQGYAPAWENLAELEEARKKEERKEYVDLASASVGDYIIFGAYEQDSNLTNGKEPIEWMVLDIRDDKALLISKYALDCQPYHTELENITWETCSLRRWLNEIFLDQAFNAEEQKRIPEVSVTAEKNPKYNTNPGNDTRDQIFLMSITEAGQYFSSNAQRTCMPTAYAEAKECYVSQSTGTCRWWLRSAGRYSSNAVGVSNAGSIWNFDGYTVNHGDYAVRPAIWIDFDNDNNIEESPVNNLSGTDPLPEQEQISIGDYITFGAYEQDNNLTNGPEPIEWLVLDVQDGKALLISEYGLDCQPYNISFKPRAAWDNCSLRAWLNNTFINSAFNADELNDILPTNVRNTKTETTDLVFLISISEANKYYSSDSVRQCRATEYAIAHGSFTNKEDGNCWWWLRSSSGNTMGSAAYIDTAGSIKGDGQSVSREHQTVRPALWIDLGNVDTEQKKNVSVVGEYDTKIFKDNSISVGDYITFGTYEQDNDLTNGKEPIEWLVLDVHGDRVFLISRYGLDYQKYYDEYANITWEGSSLRKWLNRDFLEDAFSPEEKNRIISTIVPADENPDSDTDPGNETNDNVFVLSIKEAYKYFPSDEERACEATTFAEMARTRRNGAGTKDVVAKAFSWWLRTPGVSQNRAAGVDSSGRIDSSGSHMIDIFRYLGVRPSLWINLNA